MILLLQEFFEWSPSTCPPAWGTMAWVGRLPNIFIIMGTTSLWKTRPSKACGRFSLSTIFSASYFLLRWQLIRCRWKRPKMIIGRTCGGAFQWQATGGGTRAAKVSVKLTFNKSKFDQNLTFEFKIVICIFKFVSNFYKFDTNLTQFSVQCFYHTKNVNLIQIWSKFEIEFQNCIYKFEKNGGVFPDVAGYMYWAGLPGTCTCS